MNHSRQQILAILLAIIMVAGAGCSALGPGWGEDGPAEDTDTDENDSSANPLVCGYASDAAHDQQAGNSTDCPADSDDGDDGDDRNGTTDGDGEDETHEVTVTLRTPGPDAEPIGGVDVQVVTHEGGEQVATGTTDENGQVTFDLQRGGYELLVDHDTTEYVAIGTFLFGVDGSGNDVQFVLSPPIEDGKEEPATTDQPQTPDNVTEREKPADAPTGAGDDDGDSDSGEQSDQTPAAGDDGGDDDSGEDRPDDAGDGDSEQDPETEQPEEPESPEPESPEPEQPDNEPEQPPEQEQPEQPEEPESPDEETHKVTVNAGEAVPVEGVEITITGENNQIEETLTTDESGAVVFNVPDGEYTITGVDQRGYEQTTTVTVDGEDTSVLLGGMAAPDPPVRTVTFEVVNAETGEPIEGASITGIGNRLPGGGEALLYAETGADGSADVEAFESSYSLDIRADGYETSYQSITVDDDMMVEISLTPDGTETTPPENETGNESGQSAVTAPAAA